MFFSFPAILFAFALKQDMTVFNGRYKKVCFSTIALKIYSTVLKKLEAIIALIFFFQLCPDQPCGSNTAVGNGITLPTTDPTMGGDPCIAFSVGTDMNGDAPLKANECLGDLIRIPGKYSSSRWIFSVNLSCKNTKIINTR